MQIQIFESKERLGEAAATHAADLIREAIRSHGAANLLLATGVSQLEMLEHLVRSPGIDWGVVAAYHLDEYLDLPGDHPGSLRQYLQDRFIGKLPATLANFHIIHGETDDPVAECKRLGRLLAGQRLDVGCLGIGENGHIAFNDPPADFETGEAFLTVNLDETSRRQQHNEGWFERLEDVPVRAITMSVREIMKCRSLIVVVPETRKASAVANAVNGPITPKVPASILQRHPDCMIYLDQDSAAQLAKTSHDLPW